MLNSLLGFAEAVNNQRRRLCGVSEYGGANKRRLPEFGRISASHKLAPAVLLLYFLRSLPLLPFRLARTP